MKLVSDKLLLAVVILGYATRRGLPVRGLRLQGRRRFCRRTERSRSNATVARERRVPEACKGDVIFAYPLSNSESEGACDTAIRIMRNLKTKIGIGEFLILSGETLARDFHETYEELAPEFGRKTSEQLAKPWDDVPEQNRLLTRTCESILSRYGIALVQPMTKPPVAKEESDGEGGSQEGPGQDASEQPQSGPGLSG